MPTDTNLPSVLADLPVSEAVADLLAGRVRLVPWEANDAGRPLHVDAVYTFGHPRVDGPLLDRLTGVKLISNHGVGVDHIDVAAAVARGVPVANTPGVLDGATADMAWALLMAAARRIVEADRYARSGEFTTYDPSFMPASEVHGATLGIIGLGRIGSQIARRAAGFEMNVLYHNRSRRDELEVSLGVRYRPLAELLGEADYVVTSAALSEASRGLIGRRQLQQMKTTAILVNIGRGGLVDTAALTDALRTGQIRAAALDVTEPEPLPRDHPLLAMENLVIAPHLGSNTVQTRQRMAEVSVQNLFDGLAGRSLQYQVTR